MSLEKADDSLYLPVIKRVNKNLKQPGLFYVGDCKMSAFDIRLYIAGKENHYLLPLPLTSQTATEMETGKNEGVEKDLNYQLDLIFRTNDKGKKILVAGGYEFEREQCGFLDEKEIKWTERVLVIKSPAHATQKIKGLEKRLETAITKIKALTPERGRGKRQITQEKQLNNAIEKILKKQQVASLVNVKYEKQVEQEICYVGKGRGSKNRQTQVKEKIRYSIIKVSRNIETIDDTFEPFWLESVCKKCD